MKGDNRFSWRARGRSFRYAWQGIRALLRDEHNARIHVCVAALVIIFGGLLGISPLEWCVVALCMGGVLMAEAFNSAVEALCDKVSPGHDPLIGKAKDLGAGAVLLFVAGAVTAGLIIFVPKLWALILLLT